MTPEEQQLLAAQALQSYAGPPQPALPPMSTPDQTWASGGTPALATAALQGYGQPAPAPAVPPALPDAAIQGYNAQPGLSSADQQALASGALQGYGAAPAPQWTDPNQPGPGAVTDEQMLAASAPPAAALAAVPPSAVAATEQPPAVQEAQSAPAPEAAPVAPEAAPPPPRPAPRNLQEALDAYQLESQEEADAKKKAAEVEATGLVAHAGLTQEQAADVADRLKRHNAALDLQMSDIKQLKDDMRAANERAEAASHIEHKETTRSKIAGMLALLGGALGDAFAQMGGNANPQYLVKAQEGLDKAVQLDLAQQRERYNNAKDSAKAKNDELSIAIKLFGQTPEADDYANLLTTQRYNAELGAQTAQAKSDTVRAGGQAVKESVDADTAQKMAELMQRIASAREAAKGRASAYGPPLTVNELRDAYLAGTLKNPKQIALAKGIVGDDRSERGADFREGTAEGKAAAAAALERAEIIPGLMRRPNMVPLSDPQRKEITSHYASTAGVAFLADKAAQLWEVVMDETRPKEERMAARAEFDGIRGRLQSGESVNTGQGTITASDAARTDGAMPKLPPEIDIEGIGTWARNKFQGKTPNAETFRRMSMSAMEEADTKLRKAYGLVPVEEGTRLWAEHDAAKAPKQPKGASAPKGETSPKGESKSALPPPPEGKVAVIRVSDGKRFFATPEAAQREIAKDPSAYRTE